MICCQQNDEEKVAQGFALSHLFCYNRQQDEENEVHTMNFSNLQYFVTLAEELNYTKAANRLYISQQALSVHISKLETYYNVTLFVRSNPLELTAAGKRLYLFAKEALASEKLAREQIKSIDLGDSPTLRIGTTLSRGNILMPMILPAFQKKCPDVRIEMVQNTSSYIYSLLRNKKIDILLANTPAPSDSMVSEFLYAETLTLCFTKSCIQEVYPEDWTERIKKLKEHSDLQIIKEMRFLKMYDSLALGKNFNELCRMYRIVPNVYLELRGIETMVSMCMEGLGAMVCPEMFISFLSHSFARNTNERLYSFPIGVGIPASSVSLTYWKAEPLPQYMHEFIHMAKETVRQCL